MADNEKADVGEYICPHCRNPVYDDDALLCHFCGESLSRPGSGFMGQLKYSPLKIAFIAVIVLTIVSFLLLLLR